MTEIEKLKGCPEGYKELSKKFKAIFEFNVEVFLTPIFVAAGLFSFDIMKFDDWYKKKYGDYEDNKTSLSDAIEKRFGKEVKCTMEKLLNITKKEGK